MPPVDIAVDEQSFPLGDEGRKNRTFYMQITRKLGDIPGDQMIGNHAPMVLIRRFLAK